MEKSLRKITRKEDLNQICRTCLGANKLSPIFETITINNLKVSELLAFSVKIEVTENDSMPQNICDNCLTDLFRFYEFKKQCHKNESSLKLLLEKLESEIKYVLPQNDEIEGKKSQDWTYSCSTCAEMYSTEQELLNHKREAKHGEYLEIECETCQTNISCNALTQHVRTHLTQKKLIQCGNKDLSQHNGSHSEELQAEIFSTEQNSHADNVSLQETIYTFISEVQNTGAEGISSKVKKYPKNENLSYSCTTCSQRYPTKGELKTHKKKSKHVEYRYVQCKFCDKQVSNRTLHQHVRIHTDRPFQCDLCPENFSKFENLKRHKRMHPEINKTASNVKGESSNELPYVCRACDQTYSTQQELVKHKRELQHVEYRMVQCEVCKKNISRRALSIHMRTHSEEKPHQCDICLKTFTKSENLQRHKMTHTGERPFICSICGKGFTRAAYLNDHEKLHIPEHDELDMTKVANLACPLCGRLFKNMNPFNKHLKKHRGELPEDTKEQKRDFMCDRCPSTFTRKGNLNTHLLSHGGNRFLCNECGKGFVRNDSLQAHLRSHRREKVHTCAFCEKSFSRMKDVVAHCLLAHAKEKPFKCGSCPMVFKQSTHLKHHLRMHRREKPFCCSVCGRRFGCHEDMKMHVLNLHGEKYTKKTHFCSICYKGFYYLNNLKRHMRLHENSEEDESSVPPPSPPKTKSKVITETIQSNYGGAADGLVLLCNVLDSTIDGWEKIIC